MNLVDALKKFNRKERYWLVREALGQVELCEDFRYALKKSLCLDIPHDAYWAIDYHFDWLAGVATKMGKGSEDVFDELHDNVVDDDKKYVRGTQQDIDLIVAFENTLILIECKAGGKWHKNQLKEKFGRYKLLEKLFDNKTASRKIDIKFVVLSPNQTESKFEKFDLKLPWLGLKTYQTQKFWYVERRKKDHAEADEFTQFRVRNSSVHMLGRSDQAGDKT